MNERIGSALARVASLWPGVSASTLLIASDDRARGLGGRAARRRRGWGRSFGAVDEVEDDVGFVERGERGARASLLERVARIEEARRVEEDHLHVVGGVDADDAVACRLRLGADDAELFADDAIEERGFSGVRFSDDGDDSGFRHSMTS